MRIYKRNGTSKWWAKSTDQNGRHHRKSTGTDDKELAQVLAAKWQQESFMEKHFGVIPDTPFRDALLRYGQERQRENLVTYEKSVKYRLQRLLDKFDGKNLTDITHAVIRDWADERLAQVKPASALRDLSTLRAIFNKAFRLYEVMHLTGHKSYQMVQRYAHLAPDFQERAISALNAYGSGTVLAQSA